ncbi:hypothetical protein ACFVFS_26510 [Kitasatospora sp. NPDC057692]|uniref:hypothetical protein n=1 Tax=Kitasatospora sp. NPDC057692 TaxID=3346215 RepID=UPI0036BCE529
MVPGAEIAVGYVFAWLVRKARLLAGRADTEVDQALGAGMDRLHELVAGALGQDPALERAAEEAEQGELSARTRRRLTDSLEDAAERNPDFSGRLAELVEALRGLDGGRAAAASVTNTISGSHIYGPVIQGRDVSHNTITTGPPPAPRRAEDGGTASAPR